MTGERRTASQWLPALVLLALAAALFGAWMLFPRFMAYMQRQDCVASGHVNCGDG